MIGNKHSDRENAFFLRRQVPERENSESRSQVAVERLLILLPHSFLASSAVWL